MHLLAISDIKCDGGSTFFRVDFPHIGGTLDSPVLESNADPHDSTSAQGVFVLGGTAV